MQSSLADLVEAWHDFDVLIGTAAATLIGLMFVAASIGASVYTEKDRAAMEAFISPTVVHFSAVLFVAILSLVPSHAWPTLAGLLALWGDPRRNLFGQSLAPTLYPPPLQRGHRRSPVLRADPGLGLSPSPARRLRPVPAISGGPRSARRRADHASHRRPPQRLGHDALDRDPRPHAERRRPRQNLGHSGPPSRFKLEAWQIGALLSSSAGDAFPAAPRGRRSPAPPPGSAESAQTSAPRCRCSAQRRADSRGPRWRPRTPPRRRR